MSPRIRGADSEGTPPLEAGALAEAVRFMGNRKAAGVDAWKAEELKELPLEAWQELVGVLRRAEVEGIFPPGMEGAKLVFLPKGEGGQPLQQRPIGILPLIYRVWARARLRQIEQAGLIDTEQYQWGGVRGRSALEAAFEAAMDAELAGRGELG